MRVGRSTSRIRAARPDRSRRGTRWAGDARKPAERGHAPQRNDPMRVLIVDDAVLIRAGLARLLADQGFDVVGEAESVESLPALVSALRPDVVVLDIRLPPALTDEGLVAAAWLRHHHPDIGVLVLSQHLEAAYALRLLREHPAGAGYLLKERLLHVDQLGDALRRVAAGECVVDRSVV